MMGFKLLVLVLLIKTVAAKISLDIKIDNGVEISFTGTETHSITDEDFKTFDIGNGHLFRVLEKLYGHRPQAIGQDDDEPLEKELSIKSTRVKRTTKHPIVLMAQNFENSSNHTIKVNAGLSHIVANTLKTKWSSERKLNTSADFKYDLKCFIASSNGAFSYSFTDTWGEEEEKSVTETIGTTSGVEVELKPGDAVTAVLSANAGFLEVEVVYTESLTGNIVYALEGNKYIEMIEMVMSAGGIKNEVTTTETIKFNYYVESNLKIRDTKTGLLFL